jgi:parallel beta-helix repeat protein
VENNMKRKWLAIGIILLFVGTCIIPAIAQGTKKPLPTSRGNWLYVGGSGPGNYTMIQDAVDNATDNDTVFVYDDSSPYYESVVINKTSISLIGEDKNTTVIDGSKTMGSAVIIYVDNVKIAGLMMINGWAGIYMNSQFNTIIGNNICFNEYSGIYFEDGSSNVIAGNTIYKNGNFGVFLEFVSTVDIIDNVISSNEDGIGIFDSHDINLIDNVIFSNNDTGANIYATHICTITGNIISNNSKEGMLISMSSDNLIRRNTFQNNFLCFLIGLGNNNSIEENNFIDNTINAYSNGGEVWSANYWDNWIGLKFHGPICQRFPKIIPGFPFPKFDWHPAKEPYDIRGK